MRLIRHSLFVLAACLAAVAFTGRFPFPVAGSHSASLAAGDSNQNTGHLHDTELPWKSSPHRLGLRRSSEPVKSLLDAPTVAIFRLSAPAMLVPEFESTPAKKLLLHQRSPRAPPLVS